MERELMNINGIWTTSILRRYRTIMGKPHSIYDPYAPYFHTKGSSHGYNNHKPI